MLCMVDEENQSMKLKRDTPSGNPPLMLAKTRVRGNEAMTKKAEKRKIPIVHVI